MFHGDGRRHCGVRAIRGEVGGGAVGPAAGGGDGGAAAGLPGGMLGVMGGGLPDTPGGGGRATPEAGGGGLAGGLAGGPCFACSSCRHYFVVVSRSAKDGWHSCTVHVPGAAHSWSRLFLELEAYMDTNWVLPA